MPGHHPGGAARSRPRGDTLSGVEGLLWFIAAVAVCGSLFWLAYRIEPHWVAKDGARFVTTAQVVEPGVSPGVRREVRVAFVGDDQLLIARRSMLRTKSAMWRVRAKAPRPPRRKEVYLCEPIPADPMAPSLLLRVPKKSRVVPVLDAMAPVAGQYDPKAKLMQPGTRRWGRPADRG